MEDPIYAANVLAERACALCGTDRHARKTPLETACAACGSAAEGDERLLVVDAHAAGVACSIHCAEALLREGLRPGGRCPVCGSTGDATRARLQSCRTCAAPLGPGRGYLALWRAGRMYGFCAPECLDSFRRSMNPFCG